VQLFLGIDGGGTGCRAALADADGRILARADGGAANITSDAAGALANILAVTTDVLTQGVGASAVPRESTRLQVAMGLAGATIPDSVSKLRNSLPFTQVQIVTDAVTALKGALGGADGIVAVVGTGSVFASQIGGAIREIGGRGLILGDEGSGAWLGRALLSASLRAFDGFAEMTPLLQEVLDEKRGPEGVIAFAAAAAPSDFAKYARRIIDATDTAARALMDMALAHIDASIAVLQTDPAVPVVFLGGIGKPIAARFADKWNLRDPIGDGVDGALWLARHAGPGA
jgi:glucosamine kinase